MESMFRQFESSNDLASSSEKPQIIYFKVKSNSKTEDTKLGHRPYGFLENEEGDLEQYPKAQLLVSRQIVILILCISE
jgi:hypothetical protein